MRTENGKTLFRVDRLPWLALFLVILVAGHLLVSVPSENLFGRTLHNSLHIPVFAVVASVLWLSLRHPRPLTVILITAIVAVFNEGIQILSPRDNDLKDLGLDLMGASVAVLGWMLYERYRSSFGRLGLVTMAVIVVILTVAMPLRVLLAYQHRDTIFPKILEVRSWILAPLIHSNSFVQVIQGPDVWPAFADQPVLQLRWHDQQYPGIHFEEIISDWSKYDALIIDAYIPEDTPLMFTVAAGHMGTPGTSAYVTHLIGPGPVNLRVPLSSLILDSNGNPAKLSHLILHTSRAYAGRVMLLGSVRLESSDVE